MELYLCLSLEAGKFCRGSVSEEGCFPSLEMDTPPCVFVIFPWRVCIARHPCLFTRPQFLSNEDPIFITSFNLSESPKALSPYSVILEGGLQHRIWRWEHHPGKSNQCPFLLGHFSHMTRHYPKAQQLVGYNFEESKTLFL